MNKHNLQHITLVEKILSVSLVVTILVIAAMGYYGYVRVTALSSEVAGLNARLASTTVGLKGDIAAATTSLGEVIQNETKNVKAELGGVKDQVGSIGGTVTDLQKLSKTDPELLAKYSKVFFLSDNYEPARLVEIPSKYLYSEKKISQIIPEVLPYLTKMLKKAEDDEVPLYVQSAYRSFATQVALKGAYTITYGAGTANSFSADQGYSEHQLGTTVDLITTGTGGQLDGFDKTEAYKWMQANAYRYGFVLSYPMNNNFYVFEPWHWRFVGIKLATELHKSDKHFYEMDQRTIDTYLINLYD